MHSKSTKSVLVVGQTPPPFHGQAMMIKRFVEAEYEDIKVYHVRTAYSNSMEQIGKASFSKIFHLLAVIYKTYRHYLLNKPEILVYYPITNSIAGILKDNMFMFFTRWMFKKKVFYFRSAGLIDFLNKKPRYIRNLLTVFMKYPDLCILLDKDNPKDDIILKSKKVAYLPNGIEDKALDFPSLAKPRPRKNKFTCIYIGLLKETKGVLDLIEAIRILVIEMKQDEIILNLIGKPLDEEFGNKIRKRIEESGLVNNVFLKGQLIEEAKWEQFSEAQVLCFPTYYENESFGNVNLEAFMSSLPVIATDWRGIKNIVEHKANGFIVPIKSPESIAKALLTLYKDENLRLRMAKAGRLKYEKEYQLKVHLSHLENLLVNL